uniref:F-box domain-containing protein n=1 Tax=Plectus sambesii TaxID=2011161 RepID=A0A914UYN1_9BILA
MASSSSNTIGRVLCHIGELSGEVDGRCGNDRESVTTLDQCTKDTPFDLDGNIVTDGELIGSRFDLYEPTVLAETTVCTYHRDRFGLKWRKSRYSKCLHCERKANRKVNFLWSKRATISLKESIPAGEELCQRCFDTLKQRLSAIETEEEEECEVAEEALEQPLRSGLYDLRQAASGSGLYPIEELRNLAIDDDSRPNSNRDSIGSVFEPVQTPRQRRTQKAIANTFSTSVGEKEIKRTLDPSTEWSNTSRSAKSEGLTSLARIVKAGCSVIAPGKESEIWAELKGSGHVEKAFNIQPVPAGTARAIINSFHLLKEDKNSRRVLLSAVSTQLSFGQVRDILPTVTQYEFKMAQKHAHTHGPGRFVQPTKLYRVMLTKEKAAHFIDYIFDHGVLLDKAWATSKSVKFSTGDRKRLTEAVIYENFHTIIERYDSYCDAVDFKPLGRSALYEVLKNIPLVKTDAVECLDMRIAEGKEAMKLLEKVITMLPLDSDQQFSLTTSLKLLERHIQSELKLALSLSSECQEHCITFALDESDGQRFSSQCDNHSHLKTCEKCLLLPKLQEKIVDYLQTNEFRAMRLGERSYGVRESVEDLTADVCEAFAKLSEWRAHQVRAVNQNRARIDVMGEWLKERPSTGVYIHQDFAQKFLPQKFYESQKDYYAKTGISWHTATATICRDGSTLETGTLVHIFDNHVKQDSALVTAIDHHLLSSLKRKYPLLSEVVFGSDCGQSYLASNTLLSLTRMEQETGISVKEYCFTEPQAGKSMCDRMTAVLKTQVRAYLNQGNNVETPAEVYKALTHNGGVRDCGVALVSYPPAKKIADQSQKIKNISLLRNFTLEQDRVISYKAYGMGSGQ